MSYKALSLTLGCAGAAAIAFAVVWKRDAPLESVPTTAEVRDPREPIPIEEAPATGLSRHFTSTAAAEREPVVEAGSERRQTVDDAIRELMEGPAYPADYGGPRDERVAYLYKVFASSLLRNSESMRSIDRGSRFGREQLRRLALNTAIVEKLQRNEIFAMSVDGSPPLQTPPNGDDVYYHRLNMGGLDLIVKITSSEYPDAFLKAD